jgi:hypothetical protein
LPPPVRPEVAHVDATTWSELAATPCARHGATVRFTVQFHGVLTRWQAGPTRFGPGTFRAFTAWSDEQFPWEDEAFENPHARAFARRGSEPDRTLERAHPHERFEIVAVVREVWNDRPWVEVLSATPLPDAIGEATVIHAARALDLVEAGSFALADQALQQALAAPMPPHAREELSRIRTICSAEIADPAPVPIRPRTAENS